MRARLGQYLNGLLESLEMSGDRARYVRFAWGTLWFTLFVVVWGGLVSATGAGDGCGDSWPLCGELLAGSGDVSRLATVIELTHRLTSGMALLAVVLMVVWARRIYPIGHRARFWANAGLAFMVIESLIGAALVVFRLVDMNVSLARALIQPVHMTNTYLLMGALGLAAWWAESRRRTTGAEPPAARLVVGALVFVILLSMLGTTASLASTVFPSESFVEGVRADFTRDAHYLIRLRIWHPVLALGFGGYLLWLGRRLSAGHDGGPPTEFHVVAGLYGVDLAVGALDAFLLAPIAIQLLHLLLAHAVWIGLVALWVRLVSDSGESDRAIAVG